MAKRNAPARVKAAPTVSRTELPVWVDYLILAVIYALLLAQTWRKWPDVLIDFGRELYNPWRIASGDVLYRDIVHYYGPLGSYANALWFRLFGVGYSTIIGANLALSLGLTALLRWLLGTLTGRLAATAATLSFLLVFCCGTYVGIGNYNFLSPYSHDVTYGTLACVALVAFHVLHARSGHRRWLLIHRQR